MAKVATASSLNGDLTIHEIVTQRLRQRDLRYTAGRRAIVTYLVDRGHPASIADIAANLRDVPRSSAYRHLVDLQSAGVVRKVAANDEFARFELAEDLTEHHHHLLCVSCGTVSDITPTAEFERTVSTMVDELAEREGFRPTSHALDVQGVCRHCE